MSCTCAMKGPTSLTIACATASPCAGNAIRNQIKDRRRNVPDRAALHDALCIDFQESIPAYRLSTGSDGTWPAKEFLSLVPGFDFAEETMRRSFLHVCQHPYHACR